MSWIKNAMVDQEKETMQGEAMDCERRATWNRHCQVNADRRTLERCRGAECVRPLPRRSTHRTRASAEVADSPAKALAVSPPWTPPVSMNFRSASAQLDDECSHVKPPANHEFALAENLCQ